MQRGGKIVGTVAMLSVAACGGEQGKLQIRSMATPLAAGQRPVPFRIAEARGQFALGNIGLALEAFRMALREDPSSVDAMSGIAACYDRMARFDLSRRHYEAALAIAPSDPQLLTAFAASLDLQGRRAEAALVRSEVTQRMAVAATRQSPKVAVASLSPRPADVAPMSRRSLEHRPAAAALGQIVPVERAPALAERAPAARPVQSPAASAAATTPVPPPATAPVLGRSVTIALPPVAPAMVEPVAKPAVETAIRVALPAARPAVDAPPAKPAIETMVRIEPPPAVEARSAKPAAVSAATPAPSATAVPAPTVAATEVAITLPPARPAVAAPREKPPAEEPVTIARAEPKVAKETLPAQRGPRLERTSLVEVALVTAAEPKWRPVTVRRTQRSATVRFVPERHASLSLSGIRILNAARVNRLAARTRSHLVGQGWSPMRIGNAATVRARSVILYPPERRRTAVRLSAQFGFVIAQRPGVRHITVLLGRDATRLPSLRAPA